MLHESSLLNDLRRFTWYNNQLLCIYKEPAIVHASLGSLGGGGGVGIWKFWILGGGQKTFIFMGVCPIRGGGGIFCGEVDTPLHTMPAYQLSVHLQGPYSRQAQNS